LLADASPRRSALDRFEQEHSDFHERVRQAYLERAAAAPQRISGHRRRSGSGGDPETDSGNDCKILFMNIIELHSAVWQQLCARRQQLPHALLIAGPAGNRQVRAGSRLRSNHCSAKTSLLPVRPAANAWPAAGWRKATTRICACCSRVRSLPTRGLTAGEGEEAGKKKPSQQITIDQVRELDDFLHVGTHRHGVRVVLLNPAEAMNRPTANALLKSLEEPIANTLFILVSSEPYTPAADDP
jgi:hypothetical protein